MQEQDEIRNAILLSADKHPNSRVSKLIRNVEADRSQKNIVLLLIELAEHAEYATDFSISLKYYLDLFDRLGVGHEIVLNETGLLLLNSSKIYGRRVDYVYELVERQIITLGNADKEVDQAKNVQQSNEVSEKPKRGRKRLVEAPKDPYEIELIPKKFRKITNEKRFAINTNNNAASANKIKMSTTTMRQNEVEQYIHPAGWIHAHIIDLENEEEIDSKRNYKLFTHHVEHRYNTLVTDINFRLHFMVKDFIDAEEERMEKEELPEPTIWPPLSEAYVEQYLNLENRLLHQSKEKMSSRILEVETRKNAEYDSQDCALPLNETEHLTYAVGDHTLSSTFEAENVASDKKSLTSEQVQESDETEDAAISLQNDSALGESITDSTLEGSIIGVSESNVIASVENKNINMPDAQEAVTDMEVLNENLNQTVPNEVEIIDVDKMNVNIKENSIEANVEMSNESQLNYSELEKRLLNSTRSTKDSTSISDGTEISYQENENLTSNSSVQLNSKDSTSISDESDITCQENKDLTLNSGVQNGSVLNDSTINVMQSNMCPEQLPALNKNDLVLENSFDDDSTINLKVSAADQKDHDDTQINLGEIRIHLPHLDDEGVFFSDLDEQEQRMLSPTVMALDVFPRLPNKNNLTIIVDDDIRAMLNLSDDEAETYELPVEKRPKSPPPVLLNIMKFHQSFLKRRLLFKLGSDYDLYMQSRMRKRARTPAEPKEYREPKQMKFCKTNMNGVHASPTYSVLTSPTEFNGFSDSDGETEFVGFDENEDKCFNNFTMSHRLSRDSGVGVDGPIISERSSLEVIIEETSQDAITTDDFSNDLTEKENQRSSEGEENLNEVDVPIISELNSLEVADEETSPDVSTKVNCLDDLTEKKNATSNSAEETLNENENVDINENNSSEQNNIQNFSIEPNEIDANNAFEINVASDNVAVLDSLHKEVEISADLDVSGTKTKIQKWHEHLQPILAKSRERHHFDVFQIGTEIIDKIEQSNSDDCDSEKEKLISFQDVMENKDASYVSRYFLSSLLLANQSNIKIAVKNRTSEEPSAWSEIQFELLSTTRHTVSIEDNIGMVTNSIASKIPTLNAATTVKNKTKGTSSTELLTVPSTVTTPVAMNIVVENSIVNVNLDVVKPLKQIEKFPPNGDDYDSGIFSSEELLS